MRKTLLFAVTVLLSLSACNASSVEQRLKEYQESSQVIVDRMKAGEITEDEACSQYLDNAVKTIKKNASNEVAVAALLDVVNLMDTDEELLSVIGLLKGDNVNDPQIQKVKDGVIKRQATAEGKMFVDFEVNGVKFSKFIGQGKYVLVDFWASWCGPCKREIPNIKAVWEKYSGPTFNVLSIAVWDKKEDTEAAALEHGVVWPQIMDAQRIPTDIYGIEGIPQIMLFGPDGTILKRNLRGDAIEAEVAKYVEAR